MNGDGGPASLPVVLDGEIVPAHAVGVHPSPAPLEQAQDDATLLQLWMHGRPESTARVYRRAVTSLFVQVGKPLREILLADLQGWLDSLDGKAPASRATALGAVKSLCSFAHRVGYIQFDVARPLRQPKLRQDRAQRIITEAEVGRLIALEPSPRNHVLLRLMYFCGLRVSEACGLCWRELRGTRAGGQATVHGKGGKTRVVILPPKLWKAAGLLKREAGPDDPVLQSEQGGHLDPSQAHRIVKAACARAGVTEKASSHWLRHAHASHAIDHGAPLHVVQESLGHASLATTSIYTHARPDDGSAKYLPE